MLFLFFFKDYIYSVGHENLKNLFFSSLQEEQTQRKFHIKAKHIVKIDLGEPCKTVWSIFIL